MKIFGIDFTSAPSSRKPIVIACCEFDSRLILREFQTLLSHGEFCDFLETEGPWLGGFDFPFSQPRKFIENIGYPSDWDEMMKAFADLSKGELEVMLSDYRSTREAGDKHHLRYTDSISKSISPMMIHGVPVAKMFHAGTVALWKSPVRVFPMQTKAGSRVALEAYPALVTRKYIARSSYKTDSVSKDSGDRIRAREQILEGMLNHAEKDFGCAIEFAGDLVQAVIEDYRADFLDAICAALLAAWAWSKQNDNFGIPENIDRLEGWIINPDYHPTTMTPGS